MNIQALKDIGLSEKEIKVYISGLKLGLATVSSFAEESNLQRTTTYDLLKSLKEKGIASYVIKSGVKYFSVVNPKELLEKLEEKEKKLKEILPELEILQKTAIERPRVEFYQGIEGFKTVANNMLKEKISEYYAFVAEKNLHFLPYFHMQYRRKRKERNICVKVITNKSDITEEMKKKDKEELRETRFLNKVMNDSATSFFIYGDKIAYIMATEREQLGIIIENKEVTNFQKKIFDQLWKLAKSSS